MSQTTKDIDMTNSFIKNIYGHPVHIWIYQTVTSTNNLAQLFAKESPNTPALFIAWEQTQGRGRYGKTYYSQLQNGVYYSFYLPKNDSYQLQIPLSIIVAIACRMSIFETFNISIDFKYINDLFYQNKKVGGILCEVLHDPHTNHIKGYIIGVGLNLAGTFQMADQKTQAVAGTLFDQSAHFTMDDKINYIYNCIKFLYKIINLPKKMLITNYEQNLLGINQMIHFTFKDIPKQGIIKGIDEEGNLFIQDLNGKVQKYPNHDIHIGSHQFSNK